VQQCADAVGDVIDLMRVAQQQPIRVASG
jgi:quinolinate synthase